MSYYTPHMHIHLVLFHFRFRIQVHRSAIAFRHNYHPQSILNRWLPVAECISELRETVEAAYRIVYLVVLVRKKKAQFNTEKKFGYQKVTSN